ncbi:hypothetical protein CXY01_29030 [Cellulomonas xylanilytica]|uniref:Uncharacterized protein n=1 Tax=Cellulomonas xylanilytica TaxID=233583 RepID=A0A510V697_9CELL|nr:hypothetical protein CXY01_29030 [Cellulomonas xylanilytica]
MAAIGPALVTNRRLRSDLAIEAAMLAQLPKPVRPELREEVRRRTLLLVSATRYPPLTRLDLLALIAFTT